MNRSATECQRLERTMFVARPALESIEDDGWVLRFADGYTKRANSVNPHFGSTRSVVEKIAHCEAQYAKRGLPTIFRLTSFSRPRELDRVLAEAGYRELDRSLVLRASLDRPPDRTLHDVRCVSADAWFAAFDLLRTPDRTLRRVHRQIVEAADGERLYALIEQAGRPVACGLGVLVKDAVGLFDLFTAKEHRRQVLGSAVVGAILAWAAGYGARTAFLQVHSENEAAVRLYERFGFTIAYPYWYRIQPDHSCQSSLQAS